MSIVITAEHRALLRSLSELMEQERNFGLVPAFDAKRPLGNSGTRRVGRDAVRVLRLDEESEADIDEALQLLRECTPVLKYLLAEADFDPYLGIEIDEQGKFVRGA